jgi:hypothetical protein
MINVQRISLNRQKILPAQGTLILQRNLKKFQRENEDVSFFNFFIEHFFSKQLYHPSLGAYVFTDTRPRQRSFLGGPLPLTIEIKV